ncbi:MAG: hypothetical protein JNJ77_18635 [Planctomycetia bacterium]|nr:hypothetical protein [Planctomycetia bacterium]
MHSSQTRAQLVADLHNRIADYQTLRVAWWRLSTFGGYSPGPNNITFEDIQEPNLSNLLRELSVTIREGRYTPVPGRRVRISKGQGRGFRTLEVPNVENRLAAKAIQLKIQPHLENVFLRCSYGFRPGLSREDALCQALNITQHEQRTIWVAEDIQKAFPSVPRDRLLGVVRCYLPNPKLVDLIGRCLWTDGNTHGLPQGGPLSPLLLNLYLHHHLDKHWAERFPHIVLIRYADDILFLCRNQQEADEAYAFLVERLSGTNMRLKNGPELAKMNLRVLSHLDWLGYQIHFQPQSPRQFCVGFTSAAWEHLETHLRLCHNQPFAPLRAARIIEGWIDQAGPYFLDQEMAIYAYNKIRTTADAVGFQEIPTQAELLNRWRNAHNRWMQKTGHCASVEPVLSSQEGWQTDLFRDETEVGSWVT